MTSVAMVVGVIAIGVALVIGYLVVSNVMITLQTGLIASNDTVTNTSVKSVRTTIFAGFGLLAVGIIVMAAFALINVFNPGAGQ